MRYLAVLGRQAKISLAELESLYVKVETLAPNLATFAAETKPEIARLGGTIKLGRAIDNSPEDYLTSLDYSGKIVFGISDYSRGATARRTQNLALSLKKRLRAKGFGVRVLENKDAVLSSATVFHNQLGEKLGHVELIKYKNQWFVGLSVQNINAYAARDQKRPARDAKVGMLPPKLAQILINLCGNLPKNSRILDPFCGTGVVLQEAALMGYSVYGTDVSEKMVGHTERNLAWLAQKTGEKIDLSLNVGDATDFSWEQPIDAVAFEAYLGPPMSEPPVEIKLKTVAQDCKTIIVGFLENISDQIKPETPVVMAIPAWLRPDGRYYRLKILDEARRLGYNVVKYNNLSQKDLLYYREGQIVAREIIVLRKK